MNLIEIDKSLPFGFHDAVLNKIDIDYEKGEAVFDLEIINDPDTWEYRRGKLFLYGLVFLVVEPPDDRSGFNDKVLYIGSGPITDLNEKQKNSLPVQHLPEGAFVHWFYISAWNSFIFFSALTAEFTFELGREK